jgi:hypothetical protein
MDNEYSSRGGNPPLSWNQKKRHQRSQAARNSRTSKKHQAKRQAIAYDVVRSMNEREFGVFKSFLKHLLVVMSLLRSSIICVIQ